MRPSTDGITKNRLLLSRSGREVRSARKFLADTQMTGKLSPTHAARPYSWGPHSHTFIKFLGQGRLGRGTSNCFETPPKTATSPKQGGPGLQAGTLLHACSGKSKAQKVPALLGLTHSLRQHWLRLRRCHFSLRTALSPTFTGSGPDSTGSITLAGTTISGHLRKAQRPCKQVPCAGGSHI